MSEVTSNSIVEVGDAALLGKQRKGLSVPLSAVFLAAELSGSGPLSLSYAMALSGLTAGVVSMFICFFCTLFSGITLGKCWIILEERWDEYHDSCRKPFPAIACRAVGHRMRWFVSIFMDLTLLGVATVLLLLSAHIIGIMAVSTGISSCYWIVILGAVLCPLMWLGTPGDFWFAAIFSLLTVSISCILLLVAISKDYSLNSSSRKMNDASPPQLVDMALSFAIIMFSFDGVPSFPTFQNDMEDKTMFSVAVPLAFIALMLMNLPVAVYGYLTYGVEVDINILLSISPEQRAIILTVQILMAAHCFFTFVLTINAPAQELEEILGIPKRFCFQRCVLRSAMVLVVIFMALSLPNFGKVMALVGAMTTSVLTFVLPCVFYIMLVRQRQPQWPERTISKCEMLALVVVIAIGVIGGLISTYASITDIIDNAKFNAPCYLNMTSADY